MDARKLVVASVEHRMRGCLRDAGTFELTVVAILKICRADDSIVGTTTRVGVDDGCAEAFVVDDDDDDDVVKSKCKVETQLSFTRKL